MNRPIRNRPIRPVRLISNKYEIIGPTIAEKKTQQNAYHQDADTDVDITRTVLKNPFLTSF